MTKLDVRRSPYETLRFLLYRGGLSRKKFRQILTQSQSWRETEFIAEMLCNEGVMVLWDDGRRSSANLFAYDGGGQHSNTKVHFDKAINSKWKRMYIPKPNPTVEQLLEFAKQKASSGLPIRLSRRNRRLLGRSPFTVKNMTVSQFLTALIGIVVANQELGPDEHIMSDQIPGTELYNYGPPYGFEGHIRERGCGTNRLRTNRLAQPGALKIGDILATGCKVLSLPRDGGNGSVLIHITGGFDGHWIPVPARIPIALLTQDDDAPPELWSEASK